VPVTVIVKVFDGLDMLVDTCRLEVPVDPEVRATVGGFTKAVTPVAPLGTDGSRLTIPENPWLVSVIVKSVDAPAITTADAGEAFIEKSGGAAGRLACAIRGAPEALV